MRTHFFLCLPVNGWYSEKETHHHFLTGTDFLLYWGSAHPWCSPLWMYCWKCCLSYISVSKDWYLFPVQQLRSVLVTCPLCSGYALACAPVETKTRTKYVGFTTFEMALDHKNSEWHNVEHLKDAFTSLSLDSFCVGRSLYPEDLNATSLDFSEKPSSSVGGKLGVPLLELRLPTASQETALISGGKAPMVLISAVQGACWVGGLGTGLATPVAGAWFGFRPKTSSVLLTAGELFGTTRSQLSFCKANRGVSVPEDTFLFSVGFQSTNSCSWGEQEEYKIFIR